jgi:hypothetical protein
VGSAHPVDVPAEKVKLRERAAFTM